MIFFFGGGGHDLFGVEISSRRGKTCHMAAVKGRKDLINEVIHRQIGHLSQSEFNSHHCGGATTAQYEYYININRGMRPHPFPKYLSHQLCHVVQAFCSGRGPGGGGGGRIEWKM